MRGFIRCKYIYLRSPIMRHTRFSDGINLGNIRTDNLDHTKLSNNYWTYLVSAREWSWLSSMRHTSATVNVSWPKIVAPPNVTLDTFAVRSTGPKVTWMKIDETTIGANGVPQLPLRWYHPATSCILVTPVFGRRLFRDRSNLFRSRGSDDSRKARIYENVQM